MKTCRKCGKEKALAEFYTHPATKDGYRPACKPCTKLQAEAYRKANPEVYQRVRDNRKGTMKYRAPVQVNIALKSGKMKRADRCEECGSDHRVEAHHDDYLKIYDVRWLCSACHNKWHTENGEGKNAGAIDNHHTDE